MKKGLTELVFILDRSGSMSGLESDTIGGFNSMIAKQKKAEGEAVVSTVLFNEASRVLHDRVPLDRVAPLTDEEYEPAGCTALLDAVGDAVRHIGLVHKYARSEDVPEHTVFVITTDGMENASRRYGLDEVRRLITRQSEKYGWEFLFLGANIDAVEKFGNAVTYTPCYETIVLSKDGEKISALPYRRESYTAQAPQSFRLGEILAAHERIRARPEGYADMVDQATICWTLGIPIHLVRGNRGNVKITTPEDIVMLSALLEWQKRRS